MKKSFKFFFISLLIAPLILFSISNIVLGAPDDAFLENDKHLPWTSGEIFALTSGYNQHNHITPNTQYLLNFAKRSLINGSPDQPGTFNQSVRAIGDGLVIEAASEGENGGLGRYVKLSHGGGFETRYDHFESVSVNVGDTVTRGQEVGRIGNTGFSIGYNMQVSLWENGVLVPLETGGEIIGANLSTGEAPITTFGGKTGHFFISDNVDGIPEVPNIISLETPSCSEVRILFHNISNERYYEIYKDNIQIGTVPRDDVNSELEYLNDGLTEDTDYTYEVKAINEWGETLSASQNVTTPLCGVTPPPVPSAPIIDNADAIACNAVTLAWSDVLDENGYNIYRDNTFIGEVEADTITATDFTTDEDTTHTYFLRAFNEGGESTDSNNLNVTTPTCALVPPIDPNSTPELGGEQLMEVTYSEDMIAGFMDDPVNSFTGNFFSTYTDLEVDSVGFPTEMSRTYNSDDKRIGAFGQGWQFSYDTKLIATGANRYAIKLPNGSADYFDKNGSDFDPVFPRTVATLELDGERFLYEKPDGMKYYYNSYGQLKEILDRNNNTMFFTYNADGYLKTITDTAGRDYTLVWNQGRIQSITDPAGRNVTYTYTAENQLETATTPSGNQWQYQYNTDNKLSRVIDPKNQNKATLTYDTQGRVISVGHADGGSVSFEYNGNTTIQTDEQGNPITFVHDNGGHLTELIDQKGQSEHYSYDSHDRIASYTDRNGNTTNFSYDEFGNTTYIEKPNGYSQTITYNAFSQPLSVTDFTGTVQFQYDGNGNLTQRTDQAGQVFTYSNNSQGLTTSITNPLSNSVSFNYDNAGNLIQITNPKGDDTAFSYDGISRRTSIVDALGSTAGYSYDGDSRNTTIQDPLGANLVYTYDSNGNIASITNEAGDTMYLTYNSENFLSSRIDYEGNTWQFEYDVDQNLILERDPRGYETHHQYDSAARRVQTTLPEGGNIRYAYDGNDNVIKVIDPNNNTTNFEYNSTNALTRIVNANGDSMSYERDLLDRVAKTTDWNGNEQLFEYDELSRVVKEYTELGGEVSYSYDEMSNLTEKIDPLGRSTHYTYNEINQLTQEVNAESGITAYTYDDVGNIQSITDAKGATTTYTYDNNNNLRSYADGEGNTTEITYNPLNLASSIKDPNGNTVDLFYNKNGQIYQKYNGKGDVFSYNYDPAGNLSNTTDEIGAITTFGFDGNNKLTSNISALGSTAQYFYDAAGNLTRQIDPNGNTSEYTYDVLNRIIATQDPLNGISEFTYDANGNTLTKTDENSHTTNFSYNTIDQMTEVLNANGDSMKYGFDVVGNMTSRTDFRGNEYTYTYDNLDRITGVVDPLNNNTNFNYDSVGNLLAETNANGVTTSYTYDLANRLTQVDRPESVIERMIYDPAGNLIENIDGEGGSTKYQFDANNSLISEKSPLGNENRYEYTPTVLLSAEFDPNSHGTIYEYDLDKNLVKLTDPRGNSRDFAYDPNNNLLRENDRRGLNISYSYDALNRQTSFTDQEGNTENYSYDSVGNLINDNNRRGFETSYNYDPVNRLTSKTDAKSATEAYSYDADGNLISKTDRDGNSTNYSYDQVSNLIETIDALNGNYAFNYDPVYNLVSQTNPNNQLDQYLYDDLNRLINHTDAMNGETSITYNKRSEQTMVNNPRGFDITNVYDADSRIIEKIDQSGFSELFTYDPASNITNYTDRRGNSTTYQYNPNDELIQITDALSYVEEFSYDPNGNLLNKNDARGNNWSYTYEPRNNVSNYTLPEGQVETYLYDENENLIKKTLPKGNFYTNAYDSLDLLASSTDPLGHTTINSYDPVERLSQATDANGNSTNYSYDPLYRLTQVNDALGGATKHFYDPVGNLLETKDANGNSTYFRYDDLNRSVEEENALGNNWRYEYDPNGNLTLRQDANGEETTFTFDPNDRIADKIYPDNKENITYEYDPNGNLTEMQDKSGNSSYVFDPLNRITDQTDASNYHVGYIYDGNDNNTQIEYPNGKVLDYTYSPNNWLTASTDWQGLQTTFAFDDNENLVEEVYPNDSIITYEYNADDVLSRKVNAARGEAFETFEYQYDPNHNLAEEYKLYGKLRERGPVEEEENTVEYAYDALNRLINVDDSYDKHSSYAYDPVGNNILQENNRNFYLIDNGKGTYDSNDNEVIEYQFNETNQLVEDTYFDYEYDNNGNRLIKTEKHGWDTLDFTYDYENRMVRSEAIKMNLDPIITKYMYDGLDRRVQKYEIEGRGNPSNVVTQDTDPHVGNAGTNEGNTGGNSDNSACSGNGKCVGLDNGKALGHDKKDEESVTEIIVPDPTPTPAENTNTNNSGSANTRPNETWYTYEQFGFDPIVEFPGPNKEVHIRRAFGQPKSGEVFSPRVPAPQQGTNSIVEEGRYTYYYSDHRNDVSVVLKHNGQSLHSYYYEEFGSFYDVNQTKNNSSNFIDPHNHYTFSAKEFDDETSLNYYGARYYDAWSGTWNTQDTYRGNLAQPMSLHRYAFVHNNPLKYVDPDGHALSDLWNDPSSVAMGIAEAVVIDPILETVSENRSYETSFCTIQINSSGVVTPYADVSITKDVNMNYDNNIFTSSATGSVGVVTPTDNYGAGYTRDFAIGHNDEQGVVYGNGLVVNVQHNGNNIINTGSFVGTKSGLNHFGASSTKEYVDNTLAELNQAIVQNILKAKDERTKRQVEIQKEIQRQDDQLRYYKEYLIEQGLFIEEDLIGMTSYDEINNKLNNLDTQWKADHGMQVVEIEKDFAHSWWDIDSTGGGVPGVIYIENENEFVEKYEVPLIVLSIFVNPRDAVRKSGKLIVKKSDDVVEVIIESTAKKSDDVFNNIIETTIKKSDNKVDEILDDTTQKVFNVGKDIFHKTNTHSSAKTYAYILRDKITNIIKKYGVTSEVRPQDRYTKLFYNKEKVYMEIQGYGSRKEILQWENDMINKYKNRIFNFGNKRPKLNYNDH